MVFLEPSAGLDTSLAFSARNASHASPRRVSPRARSDRIVDLRLHAIVFLFLAILLCHFTSSRALAGTRQSTDPPEYTQAVALLAEGDSAEALELLRAATRSAPRFGPAFLRLGSVLVALDSGEERDFGPRLEAERALRQAMDLLGPDPKVLAEYALLRAKRGDDRAAWRKLEAAVEEAERSGEGFRSGLIVRLHRVMGLEALYLLDDVMERSERSGEGFQPEVIARMRHTLARHYEMAWRDRHHLIHGRRDSPPLFVAGRNIPGLSARMSVRVREPAECWPLTAKAARRDECDGVDPAVGARARMLEHFRAFLSDDPGDVDVGIRLLSHLADEDEWEEYNALAHELTAAAPDDPRAFLFRGLGLHHVGRSDLADSVFQVAKTLMPPDERERLRDIGLLLWPTYRAEYEETDSVGRREVERIFYTITDPIYLTDVEERRMEHYSRVAWADLWFDAPEAVWRIDGDHPYGSQPGLPEALSEASWLSPASVYVRYGQPDSLVSSSESVGGGSIWDLTGDDLDPDGPLELRRFRPRPLGRWVAIWYYRLTPEHGISAQRSRIDLTFGRPFLRPEAWEAWPAKEHVERRSARLEVELPEFYRPRTITALLGYVHQVARFRGAEPRLSRIEVYGVPPLERLGVEPDGGVQLGLFLHDHAWHLAWHDKRDVVARDPVLGVSYAVDVDPGRYHYTLEARRSGPDSVPRPLARTRLGIEAEEYPDDRVSLSDLLLADAITPRVPSVTRRDELVMEPSRTLVFRPGDPVHVYFEIYGLAADAEGWAHYRAELVVSDSAGQTPGLIERLTRGEKELFSRDAGAERAAQQSWERTVSPDPDDDRAAEYLTLELPPLREGVHRVRIKVTDLRSGHTTERHRDFIVYGTDPG